MLNKEQHKPLAPSDLYPGRSLFQSRLVKLDKIPPEVQMSGISNRMNTHMMESLPPK